MISITVVSVRPHLKDHDVFSGMMQVKNISTNTYIVYAIGVSLALVGMQWDLGYHETHPFDTYLTMQHAAIYSGVFTFGGAAVLRYLSLRHNGIRIDTITRLVLVSVAVMLAGGVLDWYNHTYILHAFGTVFSWSHFPFVGALCLACYTTWLALRRTALRMWGMVLAVMGTTALVYMIMSDFMPIYQWWTIHALLYNYRPWYSMLFRIGANLVPRFEWWRPPLAWGVAIAASTIATRARR